MAFKIPPTPTYTRNIAEFERIFKLALQRISRQLAEVDPKDLVRQELYESQIRQLTFILNEMNTEARKWIEQTLTDSFTTAQAMSLITLGLADNLTEAKGKVQFSQMSRQRLEAIISDTFEDILQATTYMDRSLKKLIREVLAEVIRIAVAQQRSSRDISRELITELVKKGFSKSLIEDNWKGIVDARGNRWDLTTYARMVAKTKIQQTQIEGARLQALENDTDLAIISSHGASDACRHFEGMIISLEGRTKGYPTYQEVRASGLIFHPNCQHIVLPIGDIDALPKNVIDRANEAQKTAVHAMSNAKKIKSEDNKRRYRERKARRRKKARSGN